jgi:[acyl-carrier-protein] S-malonyltransferase
MFDGQGAFRPGIGKELYTSYTQAKKVIDKSSDVLGYDLKEYLWGDKDTETTGLTSVAQPAISTISLAYASILSEKKINADIALGHSLGEVTAIVYCGIVSYEDGIKIIQKRGELMEREGKVGTMMAVINVSEDDLNMLCKEVTEELSQPVVVANINAPNQIVVSGSKDAIKKLAQRAAKSHGRGIPLKVGGAWHSPFLNAASNELAGFLDTIPFSKPQSKFYSVKKFSTIPIQ